MKKDLWSPNPFERLHAARQITASELESLHNEFGTDCPVEPWPFGNATVVNPIIVTLGVSQGNSPAIGDKGSYDADGHVFPTSGTPHPGIRYRDTAGYWDKLRKLAKTTVLSPDSCENDYLSLFGNLNLDTGLSGEAMNVEVRSEFAAWILGTIRHKLRPRFVLLLGLSTYLRSNNHVAEVFQQTFTGFDIKRPLREIPFQAYESKKLVFREWDISIENNRLLTIVMWPQHPSRAPFSNSTLWQASCDEFAARHRLPIGEM